MKKFTLIGLLGVLLGIGCQETPQPQSSEASALQSIAQTEVASGLSLKSAANFPVGNVWSGGHPTWGNERGTDLGGPGDDFSPTAYNELSTVHHKNLNIEREHQLINSQFNSITPEMALKMHNICITPDSIDFSEADAMVTFAKANNLRIHGHVFLFDKSVPQWALDYKENNTWTRDQWEDWYYDYVTTVTLRYKDDIASWDIVNEIIDNFGNEKNDFFWTVVLGKEVVEKTFKLVESLTPNAKLFVNDNFQEQNALKNQGVVNYANQLRAKGCKVDGIGYQNHIVLPASQGGYWNNRNAYKLAADNDYLVHVSELDVSVNLLGFTSYQTLYQHRVQRLAYNNIARAYRDAVPQSKRWGITVWNVADHNSYLNLLRVFDDIKINDSNEDYPLLFDKYYNVKPAYYGFHKGLQGHSVWWFENLYPAQLPYTYTNWSTTLDDSQLASIEAEYRQVLVQYLKGTQESMPEVITQIRKNLKQAQ